VGWPKVGIVVGNRATLVIDGTILIRPTVQQEEMDQTRRRVHPAFLKQVFRVLKGN